MSISFFKNEYVRAVGLIVLLILIIASVVVLCLRSWHNHYSSQSWEETQEFLNTPEGYASNLVQAKLKLKVRGLKIYLTGTVQNVGNKALKEIIVKVTNVSNVAIKDYKVQHVLLGKFAVGQEKDIDKEVYTLAKERTMYGSRIRYDAYVAKVIFDINEE